MSRQDVLVTADWAEKNQGTDGIVFVEVCLLYTSPSPRD